MIEVDKIKIDKVILRKVTKYNSGKYVRLPNSFVEDCNEVALILLDDDTILIKKSPIHVVLG